MKKCLLLLMCVLLLGAVTLSASAEGDTVISVTPSAASAYQGDEIVFTVSVSGTNAYTSLGFILSYDKSAFELVSYEGITPSGAQIAYFDSTEELYALAFSSATAYSGELMTFTLRVLDAAQIGAAYTVTGTPSVSNGTDTVSCAASAASVSVACSHSYGAWTYADDSSHTRTCEVCGNTETASHNWSSVVTTEPTCTSEGVRTYTCADCGATRTESIPVTSHTYYNDCDPDCNVCGAIREVSHSYATVWSSDGEGHWHECTICGDKTDYEAHTPGAAATETTAQLCTVCGYQIQAALGHTHSFDTNWSQTAEYHWHVCTKSGCTATTDYGRHVYDDECDITCNVCGYVRVAPHNYSEEWRGNANGHYHACTLCGLTTDVEPHDLDENNVCTVCGYYVAPAETTHTHDYTQSQWYYDETGHYQQCDCGECSEVEAHIWDEGVITQEATEDSAGVRTYTCTVCGYQKTEEYSLTGQNETGPSGSADATDASSAGTDGTDPTGSGSSGNSGNSGSSGSSSGSGGADGSGWQIVAVAAVVLFAIGVALMVVEIVKSRQSGNSNSNTDETTDEE